MLLLNIYLVFHCPVLFFFHIMHICYLVANILLHRHKHFVNILHISDFVDYICIKAPCSILT